MGLGLVVGAWGVGLGLGRGAGLGVGAREAATDQLYGHRVAGRLGRRDGHELGHAVVSPQRQQRTGRRIGRPWQHTGIGRRGREAARGKGCARRGGRERRLIGREECAVLRSGVVPGRG